MVKDDELEIDMTIGRMILQLLKVL